MRKRRRPRHHQRFSVFFNAIDHNQVKHELFYVAFNAVSEKSLIVCLLTQSFSRNGAQDAPKLIFPMHEFENFPGLRPEPRWGAYSAPKPPAVCIRFAQTTRWRSPCSLRARRLLES